jgi:mannan endo-1,4-beta-mannosidase
VSILFCALALVSSYYTHTARAASGPLKVVGRFLQDANGDNIMLRGVNVPVYKSGWAEDLVAVANAVATTKTNVVRLQWWANPPAGSKYVDVANLDRAIQQYVDLGILPIVELHDLTFQWGHDAKVGANSDGNNQALFANTITNFWTRVDVVPILVKHQNHLVINVANEWGSSTYDDGTSTAANFIQNYTNAIAAMRAAGINAPLMVDAPKGWEWWFFLDHGQAILDADPQKNVMLSTHAYWAASQLNDFDVNGILELIKNSGLPIILGEASSNAWTNIQCDPINYANLLTTANANQIGYLLWAWYEDGQCGQEMNVTVGANGDGVTVPTAANPGFGYNGQHRGTYPGTRDRHVAHRYSSRREAPGADIPARLGRGGRRERCGGRAEYAPREPGLCHAGHRFRLAFPVDQRHRGQDQGRLGQVVRRWRHPRRLQRHRPGRRVLRSRAERQGDEIPSRQRLRRRPWQPRTSPGVPFARRGLLPTRHVG